LTHRADCCALAELKDPRMDRTKRHGLTDILVIAICATICGADDWTKMELFGQCKEKWFRTFLELPNGIPSHDTFRGVFSLLDPEAFEQCFMEWFPERDKWEGLRSLIRVRCERTVDGETSCEDHYYLSSLSADDPEKLLNYIRGHWSVENRLHWSLDISVGDDERRTHSGHGAENASRLARIALNLLKAETTLKASIKSKRLYGGWDNDYRLKVLLGPPKKNLDA
jgi:predicted transposase YbfD/YdcC